jgi:signal peptidase II
MNLLRQIRLRDALVLGTLLFGSVGCDQVSKQAAIHWLRDTPTTSYLGDTFRLTYIENHGAFLGMGAEWPEALRFGIFVVVSTALVFGALAVALRRAFVQEPAAGSSGAAGDSPAKRVWTDFSVLGPLLVAAGGISNLVDRIYRDGAVVDFMNLGVGSLRTGIFNVADVSIMVGLGLWLLAGRSRSAATAS